MYLIWNAGSSSIKYALYKKDDNDLVFVGGGARNRIDESKESPEDVVDQLMAEFSSEKKRIARIGHRIVHGGDYAKDGMLLSDDAIENVERFSHLAPLHNPVALSVVRHMEKALPAIPQHGFFDTSFFKDIGKKYFTYGIDKKIAESHKIRRYGFHGISHEDCYLQARNNPSDKVISIHLGSGCSMAAVQDGNPLTTSMGFTPLEGLVMQSRSGDIDPGLVFYLIDKLGVEQTKLMLERNSGLKGLTETSGNMLDVLFLADKKIEGADYQPDDRIKELQSNTQRVEEAQLALSVYITRIKQYLGAYAAHLQGVDVVAFTGEIGFGSPYIRDKVMEGLDFLQINKVVSIKANEEKAIAAKLADI